jgi:hypothetical protein
MTRLTSTRAIIDRIFSDIAELERLHPGRKFTPDGHLVGSLGEVLAEEEFGLTLNPASTKAHDGIAPDGRKVEVKLTSGQSISLRHDTEHLIVYVRLFFGEIELAYNGPCSPVWEASNRPSSNGQRSIRLNRVRALNALVAAGDRLPLKPRIGVTNGEMVR